MAVIVALVIGGGLGWAGHTLLAAPAALPVEPGFVVVEAVEDSVERSLVLGATATWSGGLQVHNLMMGTVTRVHLAGSRTIGPGDALYEVDLRPVRVAQGAVPAFRALAAGVRGEDVGQLQAFLRGQGVRRSEPSGVFDEPTRQQVMAWQRSVGAPRTGEIALGELLFVPTLPALVALGPGLRVGAMLAGTATSSSTVEGPAPEAVFVLPASPSFAISLPPAQATVARTGMPVEVVHGAGTWRAVIDTIAPPDGEGSSVATLAPAGGAASICGDTCGLIPPGVCPGSRRGFSWYQPPPGWSCHGPR